MKEPVLENSGVTLTEFVNVCVRVDDPEYETLTVGDDDDFTETVDECVGETVNDPDADNVGVMLAVIVIDCVGDNVPETVRLPEAVNDAATVALDD